MRFVRVLLATMLLIGSCLTTAQARDWAIDSSKVETKLVSTRTLSATAVKTIKLLGKITDGTQALPGAVVVLTATHQMTVSNAAGEFSFDVLPHAGPQQASVSYLGCTDLEVTLSTDFNASVVDLARTRTASKNRIAHH